MKTPFPTITIEEFEKKYLTSDEKQKMEIEYTESVLSLCITALKLLHPIMDKEEPCIAYEAYSSAKNLIDHLQRHH